MDRNVILAAATALVVGVWSGFVLAQTGPTGGPRSVAAGESPVEIVRAADAPRALPRVDGMAFQRVRIDTSTENPKACLEFSQNLSTDPQINFRDFLTIAPDVKVQVQANGNLLCLSGLGYEPDREVTIRQGLPSNGKDVLEQDETFTLSFGDRPTFVGFAGNGVILPRTEADGIGIETVNVSRLKVEVRRIGERALFQSDVNLGQAITEGSWDWWGYEDAGRDLGVKVYEGVMDVALRDQQGERRNQTITTVFPLGAALKRVEAGAYVVKVEDASPSAGSRGGDSGEDRPAAAYRWIIYTDLALQTFQGATGMDVVVRSLQTAKPRAGVTLALLAQNNDELTRVRTDAEGRARIPAAQLEGEGALRPRLVMAYGQGGDFTVLDLERPTLDLSDRGVSGRAAPGDVDAYMYTDRGIYRPGETVRVAGLIRDAAGRAISNRESALVVYRPNGTEARRQRLQRAAEAGGVVQNVAIDRSAPRGVWRAVLEVDGQKAPAGEVSFSVEDFVPQRLKVDVTASEAPMRANEQRPIEIDAQFLYGAAGAGLPVTGEARLQVEANPFPTFAGYQFGRADESFDEQFIELAQTTTDGDGKARAVFALANPPQTTLPLRARLVAAVAEPGGRTVREGFTIPVRTLERYVGLKSRSETGDFPENGRAAFDVVAVDLAGKPVALRGLQWTLVREDWNYDWYLDNGNWRWRRTGRDVPVASGRVDVGADKPAEIARDKIGAGQYRLIVSDSASRAESSVRFYAGWGGDAGDRDTPDMVAVAPPVDPAKPNANVRVRIKPPYAGEAQIVVATDRVLSTRTMRVGSEGADVSLRVDESWGSGAYVLVTVMTPRDAAKLPVPRRAVGVAYVPVDMGGRTIKVALADDLQAPMDSAAKVKIVRPRARLDVPIRVSGAPRGESVRMTLAAVDEGILQLTKFESPDPTKFYFGRKALGVGVRDDYGRLLNPNLGAPAIARQGGDGLGGEGLTVVPTKTVALWSGLVKIDRDGRGSIPLDVPDFNGRLRLMAVAWSETGLGAASTPLIVRDPVVAELTLPRFLSPGDEAQATLALDNVEGPAGAYAVSISGSGAAGMKPFTQRFQLDPRGQSRALVPLAGAAAGLGRVTLTVDGPGGFKVSRAYDIQSRTPFLPITETDTAEQAAGASFRLPADVLAPFAAGEGKAIVSFSPLRGIDAAPLLDVLERYPYGCSEQLTSTTMPLLYANALAAAARQPNDPKLRARVQESVNRLLDRLGSDGAFGLWRAEDRAASPWLGAYVTDFLIRAKAAGYVVPQQPLDSALKGLRAAAKLDGFMPVSYETEVFVWPGSNDSQELLRSRSAAYALYVLAKAGKADVGQLRYFHDARLRNEPSPLARAHIAAGLWRLGDRSRAASAFRQAEQALGYRNTGDYYQTPLRDLAGVLALAAEAQQTELVGRIAARLEREGRNAEELMTQEQVQLLLAADALLARSGPPSVTLNGQPNSGAVTADAARIAQGLVFANAGKGPIFRTVTKVGPPRSAPAPVSAGFSVSKRLFSVRGQPLGDTVRQGDRVVVVISGAPEGQRTHPMALVDLLPAGLEIESIVKPEDGAGRGPEGTSGIFAWIGEITYPRVAEARDDRFVAAADVRAQTFTFAYVARAVTPGRYTIPGVQAEDMYRPGVVGRSAAGTLTVTTP